MSDFDEFNSFALPPQLIAVYLERRRQDVQMLEKALQRESTQEFNKLGHQLVGNALNFGFPELDAIARKMESLKDSDLKSEGAAVLDSFKSWVLQQG